MRIRFLTARWISDPTMVSLVPLMRNPKNIKNNGVDFEQVQIVLYL